MVRALLRRLASSSKYSEVVDYLTVFYTPSMNEITESFKFFTRNMRPYESAQEYIVQLKGQAEKSNFGTLLSRMIRDKIFCGTSNREVQKLLLARSRLALSETKAW